MDTGGRKNDLETTASLVRKARAGDQQARNRLIERYLPAFRRWAHGRLPAYARNVVDTDDLVQDTLVRTLQRLHSFEPRREGALLAYLRRILVNRIRDEIRTAGRQARDGAHLTSLPNGAASPLERLIEEESVARCEAALDALTETQREAIVMRLELGFKHREVAEALGSPSEDAARMLVARALVRMAEVMRDGRE